LTGFNVTYTFTVHNLGPSTATNVVVTDPFPTSLTVVGPNTASQGSFDPTTGVWDVGTLPVGGSATLAVTARADVLGTTPNSATVHGDQFDPNLSNNDDTAVITGQMDPGDISKRFFLSGGAATDPVNMAALSVPAALRPLAPVPLDPPPDPDVARALLPA